MPDFLSAHSLEILIKENFTKSHFKDFTKCSWIQFVTPHDIAINHVEIQV